MLLGAKVRKARQEAGLTQAELAGPELSRSFISEIERNERNPSIATMRILAERLARPLAYFAVDLVKSDYDRAQLLISQAHTCLELGDRDGLASALGALRQITPLPDTLKARWHELMAWYEQAEERPLVATNHALMAEALFELEQMPDKQWYCCHLAAHATFSAGLYFQTIAMCNKALAILATSKDMPSERRLTLYLLGSAYFAIGQIDAAEKCYEEIDTLPGPDSESEILACHGRAICAQHSGNVEEALKWSERARLLAEQKRNLELHVSALTTYGSCLVRLGRNEEAKAILHTLDTDTRFPATAAHEARREFLLFWAEQDPYSVDICLPLENYLAALLDSAPADKSYERVKTRWAIAKSQLRRAPKSSVLSVIQQHAELFASLTHRGRAAEVLQFGATLMNRHGDCATAYLLMKEACELNRLAVR